ncbi:MAG: DegV family protein [Chloroflexota bacterium]
MIKIVTDTTANLSGEILARYDIRQVPIAIQFGLESYEEDVDIDRDMFYRKIEEMGIVPTTSQPATGRFTDVYRTLAAAGHDILSIHVTSKHSGTYQSAILASSLVPHARVEVFDSASISLGTGYMVLEAAQAAEKGWSVEQILDRLRQVRDRMHLFLTPATLKYLQMSGRVGKLQSALASLIQLKPIIRLEDGLLEACENVRTRVRALDRLVELLVEAVGTHDLVNVAVVHARAAQEGRELLERLKTTLNCCEIMFDELVASLAVHGGPGVVGVFVYRQ